MKLRNRSALQARLRGPYPHPEDSDKNEDNSASDDCSADVEMPDGSGKDWQDTWSPDDLGSWKAEDEDELAFGDDDIDDDGDDDIDDDESMQVSEAHEDVASSAVKHDTAEKILVRVSKKGKQNPGETPGAPAIQGSGFQDGQVIHTAEDDFVYMAGGWRLPYGQSHRADKQIRKSKERLAQQREARGSMSANEETSAKADGDRSYHPCEGGNKPVSFIRPPPCPKNLGKDYWAEHVRVVNGGIDTKESVMGAGPDGRTPMRRVIRDLGYHLLFNRIIRLIHFFKEHVISPDDLSMPRLLGIAHKTLIAVMACIHLHGFNLRIAAVFIHIACLCMYIGDSCINVQSLARQSSLLHTETEGCCTARLHVLAIISLNM